MRRGRNARCVQCGRSCTDAWMCADCGAELRQLLIGDPTLVRPLPYPQHPKTQPGIVWYIKQLYKTAYRQTRLGGHVSAKTGGRDYYLFADRRGIDLLRRVESLLTEWNDRLCSLDTTALLALDTGRGAPEALSIRQARYLAAHVRLLRRHDKDIVKLHNGLLALAREAWTVINRPPELCCGGCPTTVRDKDTGEDKKCGVILYAEETADTVQCPRCRSQHDVSSLRERMKREAQDYVLPAGELLTLMETRLNDPVKRSTFYALIRDGHLVPHTHAADGTALYTYPDVCAAKAAAGTKKPAQRRR